MHLSALFCILTSVASALAVPKRTIGFAADPSINAQGIYNRAKASKNHAVASFPSTQGGGNKVKIYADWLRLSGGVSAYHFIAAMAVDCDGVDYKCPHNPDGQPETSFGHLSATRVPFYVIPAKFNQQRRDIQPNSLGAIICNGKMYYGIFGDENGDTPETIGEASILMAQTCFPNDGLDGGTGHDPVDVLYIVFGRDVPSGVGDKTINIGALKKLGDQQATKLASALGV